MVMAPYPGDSSSDEQVNDRAKKLPRKSNVVHNVPTMLPATATGKLNTPSATSPTNCNKASTTFGPEDSQLKQKLIQQQLILLFHAYKCQRKEQFNEDAPFICNLTHCETMKNVLAHLTTCQVEGIGNCHMAHCSSSKLIIRHWKNCTSTQCPICSPFKTPCCSTNNTKVSEFGNDLPSSSSSSAAAAPASTTATTTPTSKMSPMVMGYSLELFPKKSNLDPEFVCSICLDVLRDPLMIENCQHIFCKSCINLWFKVSSNICPICRCAVPIGIPNVVIRPQRSFMNMLNRLIVKCPFEKHGCNIQKLTLGTLPFHHRQCEFNPRKQQDALKRKMDQSTSSDDDDELTSIQAKRAKMARYQHEFWDGTIDWYEKVKSNPNQLAIQEKLHPMQCKIFSPIPAEPALHENWKNPEYWPTKLILKLIPGMILVKLGTNFNFASSDIEETLLFNIDNKQDREELKKAMELGYFGYVHFGPSYPIKVIILHYNQSRDAFMGFIPNDQNEFVRKLRLAVQEERNYLQKMQQPPPPAPGELKKEQSAH